MQILLEDLDREALIALVKQQGQTLLKRDQALLQREEEIANHHKEIAERTEEITSLTQKRDYLKAQVEMLRRMQFGQKRERFEADSSLMVLPFEVLPAQEEQQQEEIKEKI